MILIIEAQVGYVAQALRHLQTTGAAAVEATESATWAWNDELSSGGCPGRSWLTGGCSSWYLDAHGRNVTLWPGTTWSFERAMARFDPHAYRTIAPSRASSSALGDAGALELAEMKGLVRAMGPGVRVLDPGDEDRGLREALGEGGDERDRPADADIDRLGAPGVPEAARAWS